MYNVTMVWRANPAGRELLPTFDLPSFFETIIRVSKPSLEEGHVKKAEQAREEEEKGEEEKEEEEEEEEEEEKEEKKEEVEEEEEEKEEQKYSHTERDTKT